MNSIIRQIKGYLSPLAYTLPHIVFAVWWPSSAFGYSMRTLQQGDVANTFSLRVEWSGVGDQLWLPLASVAVTSIAFGQGRPSCSSLCCWFACERACEAVCEEPSLFAKRAGA